jgi:hypothetical protein
MHLLASAAVRTAAAVPPASIIPKTVEAPNKSIRGHITQRYGQVELIRRRCSRPSRAEQGR